MGQVLHRGATTTEAIRRAIQHSQESLRSLARRHGINPKTVAKWRKRCSVADLPTGPKHPRSTVLTVEQEAIIVAFRKHTLLPLDDCLYALQATICYRHSKNPQNRRLKILQLGPNGGILTRGGSGCCDWRISWRYRSCITTAGA
jgi:transposase-like protein